MDGKGLAILILVFLIGLMVFYPQKSGYTATEPEGANVETIEAPGGTDAKLVDKIAPGAFFSSEPAPFTSEGVTPTVDIPVYDSTNVGLIPKEVVTTEDFAQFSPDTILSGQNFLDPRAQIGFPETIGGNLRNANRQERSEPPNPRDAVSIFNLSTIPPDTMRPKFELDNEYK